MQTLYLSVVLAPLAAALIVGFGGSRLAERFAAWLTISAVAFSFLASAYALWRLCHGGDVYNATVYPWMTVHGVTFQVGFLVDRLTALMMVIVTFVSLMVHVYSIGYMRGEAGFCRFFSYLSLFTFAMLMLVMANNFVQLFFGWEAVGLVSYLLIGFWYTKPTAVLANLKAFLINRVGDLGFLLGIGLIFSYTGTLDYSAVFSQVVALQSSSIEVVEGHPWSLITLICILLFIGAMGKSAQFPLHVWLPDSMEGPTPISALIHAATMVTAGIFMVARMSPLFELSDTALSFIVIIGAITALFMGLLGIVQNDIKRVIAYSTLSQLGYMTVALGASAYSVAVFHLMTHAFFKALLFLAAGSVIVGLHHEQNIQQMGGVRRYMPITWLTFLLASLSLVAAPFFSGFYSKETILEAVRLSSLEVAPFAHSALLIGVFVTSLYSFRLYFLVFHGKERFSKHSSPTKVDEAPVQPHESGWTMTLPLILLAIPAIALGYWTIEPLVYGPFFESIIDSRYHPVMAQLKGAFSGASAMGWHGFLTLPFGLAVAGAVCAWYAYLRQPALPARIQAVFRPCYHLLVRNYYMDDLYLRFFAPAARNVGTILWKFGDLLLIDGLFVGGISSSVERVSRLCRRLQTGSLNGYALAMVIGLIFFLTSFFMFPYFFMSDK